MSLSKRSIRGDRGPRLAWRIVAPMAMCAIMLVGSPLWAASLTGPINGWAVSSTTWVSGSGPNNDSLYVYVPDKVATNPPILLLLHYCGGNAAGVFGEAEGGGIVAASDQYGFVMVVPQTTNNCWDVTSTATQSRDGGGDSEAIAQMVRYAIPQYSANANRVYVTGTSSGATMTELLLAVYPDIFKGGAEFSGTPAGCANIFDSTGNCGLSPMTGAQWGDKVRAMDPGYTGLRPRVQLWHGEADTTLVYQNQVNAIAEWTNVLGLSSTPTSMTSLMYNGHSWTRQEWQNTCGFTVLDAWSEIDGPHGTDANLNAMYVIPFLALDQSSAVDPEVTQCSGDAGTDGSVGGSGSDAGSSGTSSGGSSSGGGGSSDAGTGGGGSSSGASGGVASSSGSSSGASGGSGGGVPGEDAGSSGAASAETSTPPACSCDVPGASGAEGIFAWAGVAALDLIRRGRRRRHGRGG